MWRRDSLPDALVRLECGRLSGTSGEGALESVDRCSPACEEVAGNLRERHREQEQRLRDVVEKHEQEEGMAWEQTQLQTKRNALEVQRRELESKKIDLRYKHPQKPG